MTQWQTTMPRTEGWYWMRFGDGEPEAVFVQLRGGKPGLLRAGYATWHAEDAIAFAKPSYSGPLHAPGKAGRKGETV
jgi:hypothetical protein